MALGNRSGFLKSRQVTAAADDGLEFGIVRYTRGIGRKRIVISCNEEASSMNITPKTPSKRRCGESMAVDSEKSPLEALPQEVLIRVLCCVDHDDLKQLVRVSKAISEATLVAKQWHFAYSTPRKVRAFHTAIDFKDLCHSDEIEAPNAPPLRRIRSPLSKKKLADISVALFSSPEEEQWPKKKLLMETEI